MTQLLFPAFPALLDRTPDTAGRPLPPGPAGTAPSAKAPPPADPVAACEAITARSFALLAMPVYPWLPPRG